MDPMDVILDEVKEITKQFSKEIGKIAKPYMRQLTAQIIAAGVPSQYLQYAFKYIFEEQRRWKVLLKDKFLISTLNSVVANEMLVPNYNRAQVADQDYSSNLNEAIKETAKWARGRPARNLQNLYTKIAMKHAVKANREIPGFSASKWLEEFRIAIMGYPSWFSGGNRTAEVLHNFSIK